MWPCSNLREKRGFGGGGQCQRVDFTWRWLPRARELALGTGVCVHLCVYVCVKERESRQKKIWFLIRTLTELFEDRDYVLVTVVVPRA